MRKLLPWLIVGLAVLLSSCAGRSDAQTTAAPEPQPAPATTAPAETTVPPTTTTTLPDLEPPAVSVDPADGSVVETYITEITVTSEPGAEVTVDGIVLVPDQGGSATVLRRSAIGVNEVSIEAVDAAGNTTSEVSTYVFEPEPGWIFAMGDSVLLGSAAEVEKRLGSGVVDATVSRQFFQAVDPLARRALSAAPPDVVVVALGTNGPVDDELFDRMMAGLGAVPRVVFVNTRVPRAWEEGTNRAIAEGVERYENAVLVDWWGTVDHRPELFRGDGFHPTQAGRVIMAELIAAAVFPADGAMDAYMSAPIAEQEPTSGGGGDGAS